MAAALANSLSRMDLSQKAALMDRYRQNCVTLGKQVQAVGKYLCGTAVDITEDGSLVIRLADGSRQIVSSGEVSVRNI